MNVIICCTPLQVLIAEKIVKLHSYEDFYGIMLAPTDNQKYRYYFDRLSSFCSNSIFFKFFKSIDYSPKLLFILLYNLYSLLRIKMFFRNMSINRLFLSNFDDPIILYIVDIIDFNEIYTFDDGTKNVVFSVYSSSSIKKKIKRIIHQLLSIGIDENFIRENLVMHYTIYKNIPNIMPRSYFIDIFTYFNYSFDSKMKEKIKILIGQPIFSSERKNIELFNRVANIYDVDYYFPHPREKKYLDGIENIKTHLIFEDYLHLFLKGKEVVIYTFFSSVVLNVASIPYVKIIAIRADFISNESILEIYDIFQKMGIEIVECKVKELDE